MTATRTGKRRKGKFQVPPSHFRVKLGHTMGSEGHWGNETKGDTMEMKKVSGSTSSKVVVLKMLPIDGSLDESFRRVCDVTRGLFNEVVCWGNDSVLEFDKEGERDLLAERKGLYDKYVNPVLSFEQFESAVNYLYTCLVKSSKSRGIATSLFGTPRDESVVTTWDPSKFQAYAVHNTLKISGFFDRFPFNVTLSGGEKYIVTENVCRMLKSWVACDDATRSRYEAEAKTIHEAIHDLPSVEGFTSFCRANDVLNHYDERVERYLRDCIIPQLKKSGEVLEHFYLKKEGSRERKVSFSLHSSFVDYLRAHPELWEGEEPVLLSRISSELTVMGLLDLCLSHDKHLSRARFPYLTRGNVFHRVQYNLGDNYRSYELLFRGLPEEDVEVSLTKGFKTEESVFSGGTRVDSPLHLEVKGICRFRVCTKDSYGSKYNPGRYLEGLRVWHKANNCTYLLSFEKGGETRYATVKEPSIVAKQFGEGEKRRTEYYVRLNMNVVTPKDKDSENLQWVLSSACSSVNNPKRDAAKESAKNAERLEKLQGREFRALGIDLGMRAPWAWAVGRFTVDADVGEMTNSLIIEGTGRYIQSDARYNEYREFLNEIKGAKKFVGVTKTLAKGESVEFSDLTLRLFDNMRRSLNVVCGGLTGWRLRAMNDFLAMSNDEVMESTKRLVAKWVGGNDLTDVKGSLYPKKDSSEDLGDYEWVRGWAGVLVERYISNRYRALRKKRQFYYRSHDDASAKWDSEFTWLKCEEEVKRLKRSVSFFGEKPKARGESGLTFDRLTCEYNGCKDNYLKWIASGIVQTAKKQGCDLIVLERLDNVGMTVNTKKENFLFSLWSPARIEAAIVNAAEWHNIKLVYVDPACTSKVHYESGRFGYRDGDTLYYRGDSGEILRVNADENAAKNILARAVSRHANITQVWAKGEQGKRVSGMLTREFGGIKPGMEALKKVVDGKYPYVYRHNGEWISYNDRRNIEDGIKAEVDGEQPKSETETKQPKSETETKQPKSKTETKQPKSETETKQPKSETETKQPKSETETKLSQKPILSGLRTHSLRTHKDLSIEEMEALKADREKGTKWKDLETKYRLVPHNGMSAVNATKRLARMKKTYPGADAA